MRYHITVDRVSSSYTDSVGESSSYKFYYSLKYKCSSSAERMTLILSQVRPEHLFALIISKWENEPLVNLKPTTRPYF